MPMSEECVKIKTFDSELHNGIAIPCSYAYNVGMATPNKFPVSQIATLTCG